MESTRYKKYISDVTGHERHFVEQSDTGYKCATL